MELKNYSIDRQKEIVRRWNYYYGKGIRTLEDIERFDLLVEENLDRILKLIALEVLTDFRDLFPALPKTFSLCNMIYYISVRENDNSDHENTTTVNGFLDAVDAYFQTCEFTKPSDEIIEIALEKVERSMDMSPLDPGQNPEPKTKGAK